MYGKMTHDAERKKTHKPLIGAGRLCYGEKSINSLALDSLFTITHAKCHNSYVFVLNGNRTHRHTQTHTAAHSRCGVCVYIETLVWNLIAILNIEH